MRSFVWRASLALVLLSLIPAAAMSQVSVGIGIGVAIHAAPPPLPVYVQPPIPGDGLHVDTGLLGMGSGRLLLGAGRVGAPAYGWRTLDARLLGLHGRRLWLASRLLGSHVGFYGGVNYGFGYGGVGFAGGAWRGGAFAYNSAVMNVGEGVVHNTYIDRTVVNNTVVNRTSFNGAGGVMARPTSFEQSAMNEHHFEPTGMQTQHFNAAANDPGQRFSANGGRPANVAMDSVNGRRYNQQGRIANGVGSGQLTAGETKNLEGREAGLNNEIHNDRQANGGKLTPQERQQVNHQQNNLSHSIYDDKHNANTAHYGDNEVGQRRYNQQQRIANGVGNGTMSAGQASRVEGREQNINRSDAADRAADGGKLTPQEKQNLNKRQNGASRQIYRDKHGK